MTPLFHDWLPLALWITCMDVVDVIMSTCAIKGQCVVCSQVTANLLFHLIWYIYYIPQHNSIAFLYVVPMATHVPTQIHNACA